MSPEQLEIIFHYRNSGLFQNGEAWIKTSGNGAFDVPQGSFDSAEVSELMSLYIFNKINEIFHVDSHGLYRDDGLMIVLDIRKVNERIRKITF